MKPKPLSPLPEIFQGGSSRAARDMAARVSDWYFTNGNTPDGVRLQVADIREKAGRHQHQVRIGLNGFVIARESEQQAQAVLHEIISKANPDAVKAFSMRSKMLAVPHPKERGTGRNRRLRIWCSTTTALKPI